MRRTAGGRGAEELDILVDSLGSTLGVEVTHSTLSFHGTTIARSLEPFTEILLDVLARPSLEEEELGQLLRESRSELTDARDDDRALARRALVRRLFGEHPYGRSVRGTLQSIRGIEARDVRGYLRDRLVGGNLVLAVSGDIDEDAALALAQRIAAALPEGGALTDSTPPPESFEGRHLVIVDKPDRTQTQIYIGAMGTHPRDEDHFALHVANTIFGGTFTARMTQEVRAKRGWSYGAYSSLPFDRQRQAFSMWTFPKASDAAACVALELEMLESWHASGVTREELAWAKRYLVRSHAFSIDTASKRVSLSLDTALYGLPPGYYDNYRERIEAVTLEQVNQAIQRRIDPRNLVVSVTGTESTIGKGLREALAGVATYEVLPFDSEEL